MILNADFHIHSPFSMATSKNTTPQLLIDACKIKGLNVLGSGDALHPIWRKRWIEYLNDNGANDRSSRYDKENVTVIPTTEVDGKGKIHHIIFMSEFEQAEQIADRLRAYSPNIDTAGRPNISLSGEEIAEIVHDCDAVIGPAHAFTPWTGMYGRVENLTDSYGTIRPDFLELGLSADTSYGDKIPELNGIPFISNSDAHSAGLNKLGREFNRIESRFKDPKGIIDAVTSGKILLNAGLFAEEGKYNRTACTKCYKQYSYSKAMNMNYKCDCGGKIKVGVYDRSLLKSQDSPKTDANRSVRPPYLHIIPLLDIINRILTTSGVGTSTSAAVKRESTALYNKFTKTADEITLLTTTPYSKLSIIDKKTADAIIKFRNGDVILHAGGGGKYGTFDF